MFTKIFNLGPAFSVVVSDPFRGLVIISSITVFLTPRLKRCSQQAMHEEDVSFDWLADYKGGEVRSNI